MEYQHNLKSADNFTWFNRVRKLLILFKCCKKQTNTTREKKKDKH